MENYLNTTLRNIAWFKQVNEQKELEMKPPFQRNPEHALHHWHKLKDVFSPIPKKEYPLVLFQQLIMNFFL